MANQEHIDLLIKAARIMGEGRGMDEWNQWRQEHTNIQPDFSEAVLEGIDFRAGYILRSPTHVEHGVGLTAGSHFDPIKINLSGANFHGAKLSHALFCGADLRNANLTGADLTRANLNEADLSGANLSEARLGWTDLSSANLSNASFRGALLSNTNLVATLDGADFNQARVAGMILAGVDLRNVKGLETVIHVGSSSVGIETLYLSNGQIPKVFLQGVGIPEIFIDYIPSLVTSPIDYHSCFISYSSQNEDFARQLYADLQRKRVRCWFAPEDLKIGDKIRPRIDESIHIHDKLLILLSRHSIASQWVEQEVEMALEKERKEQRTILFPIRLDNTVMDIDRGWPALIRNTRNIGDFTCWENHDAYQQGFERLLRDLKAETANIEEEGK